MVFISECGASRRLSALIVSGKRLARKPWNIACLRAETAGVRRDIV
jgi:hypothetical protein